MKKKALFVGSLNDLQNLPQEEVNREMLRLGIIAELDAVNFYTQMAEKTNIDAIKTIMLDVAKEEKTHAGEFQSLLEQLDKEHSQELEEGANEVKEKLSGESMESSAEIMESMKKIANALDMRGMIGAADYITKVMEKMAAYMHGGNTFMYYDSKYTDDDYEVKFNYSYDYYPGSYSQPAETDNFEIDIESIVPAPPKEFEKLIEADIKKYIDDNFDSLEGVAYEHEEGV